MDDHRLNTRLLQHWKTINKNEKFPNIEQLNTGSIHDLWPQCGLVSVDVRSAVYKYRYEYMGKGIAQAYGRDLVGTTMTSKTPKHFPGAVIIKKMNAMVKEPYPMEDSGSFVNEKGKLIKYRACFLPFGNKQHVLTHIVIGLSYREF